MVSKPKIQLYVRDLRKCLAQSRMSPEDFAKKVGLSHMTIRRWLEKEDEESLPSKYLPTLGPVFGKAPAPTLPKFSLARALKSLSIDALMAEIEKAGNAFDDVKVLEDAVDQKLKNAPPDKTFHHCCEELLKAAKSSKSSSRAQAIARGALLYFVDTLGVPDETPLVGYLGELAVLSVALNTVYSLSS